MWNWRVRNIRWFQKPLNRERFFYELAIYVENGMPLMEALTMVGESKGMAIREGLLSGASLSESFRQAGGFLEKEVRVMRLAEETGGMARVFRDLNRSLKEQRELSGKIRSILLYPSILLLSAVLFLLLALYFVVPPLHGMMVSMEVDAAFLRVADHVGSVIPIEGMGALLLFLIYLGIHFLKDDQHVYRVVLGRHHKLHREMMFAEDLGQLLKGGMDFMSAFKVLPELEPPSHTIVMDIQSGVALKQVFSQGGFSSVFVSYMAMAEETGDLVGALEAFSGLSKSALFEELRKRTAIIEPISVLFMGMVVFLAAYGMMMPLLDAYGGF